MPAAPPSPTLSGPIWRGAGAGVAGAGASNTSTSSFGSRTSTSPITSTSLTPPNGRRISRRWLPAGYLYWFVSSYTVIVSVGATALVARFVGAGDWRLARHATGQAVVLAVFFGGLGSAAGLLGLPSLVDSSFS